MIHRANPLRHAVTLLLALTIGLLVACATPQTFNDKVAATSASITAVTAAATSLATSGRITKAQATDVLAASKAASDALTTAQKMQAQGVTGAEAQLALATSILTSVRAFLTSQGASL